MLHRPDSFEMTRCRQNLQCSREMPPSQIGTYWYRQLRLPVSITSEQPWFTLLSAPSTKAWDPCVARRPSIEVPMGLPRGRPVGGSDCRKGGHWPSVHMPCFRRRPCRTILLNEQRKGDRLYRRGRVDREVLRLPFAGRPSRLGALAHPAGAPSLAGRTSPAFREQHDLQCWSH
jgi:hypothetical protein